MTTTTIYIGLFLATCAYAWLLAKFRHLWEPHLTWLEVALGVALCLTAPYLNARYVAAPADWVAYEWDVWRGFFVGGPPIIIWQLIQSITAWLRVEHRIRSRNDDQANRATTLAAERRQSTETDD